MTVNDQDDPILRRLSQLPLATPDALRAERARKRYHAAMARRTRRAQHGFARRVLEPGLIGGFSLAYVLALVHNVLRWRGVL